MPIPVYGFGKGMAVEGVGSEGGAQFMGASYVLAFVEFIGIFGIAYARYTRAGVGRV